MFLIPLLVVPFIVSFIYIWLKAIQQLNVVHDKRLYVIPVSLGMALCEVSIVTLVVMGESLLIALPIGIGGGLGCLLAMTNHKKLRGEKV